MCWYRVPAALSLAGALFVLASPASGAVLITVDKATQQMSVAVDGALRWTWPVSTGQAKYDTPNGAYTTFRMERHHFSREWDDAPMPYSIFFTKAGHAIHGSYATRRLGRPASHGCVRLAPKNAEQLFALVRQQGLANTQVVVNGELPLPPQMIAVPLPRERRLALRMVSAQHTPIVSERDAPAVADAEPSTVVAATDAPDVTPEEPRVSIHAATVSIRAAPLPHERVARPTVHEPLQPLAVRELPKQRVLPQPPARRLAKRERPPPRTARADTATPRIYSRRARLERPRVYRRQYADPATRRYYEPRGLIVEDRYVNGYWVRRYYDQRPRPRGFFVYP